MQKKLKVILFLIVFAASIFLLVDFNDVGANLSIMSMKHVVIASLLYLIFFVINAVVLVVLLSPMGSRVSMSGCLGVNQFSSLFNYIAPFRVGQIAVKAVLMKSIFDVPLSVSAIAFLIGSFLSMLVSVVLFLISSFLLNDNSYWNEYSGLIAPCVFLVAIIMAGIWVLRSRFRVHEKIRNTLQVISGFSAEIVLFCIFLLIMQIIVGSLITVVLLESAGIHIDLIVALFLSSVGNITLLVSFTPGNLGAKELTFVAVGMVLGIPETAMFAVLIVDRLLQLVISIIFSALFFHRYGGSLSKALQMGREI